MAKFKWVIVLLGILFLLQPGYPADNPQILGLWKLVSFEAEIQATGQKEPVLGKIPRDTLSLQPKVERFSF